MTGRPGPRPGPRPVTVHAPYPVAASKSDIISALFRPRLDSSSRVVNGGERRREPCGVRCCNPEFSLRLGWARHSMARHGTTRHETVQRLRATGEKFAEICGSHIALMSKSTCISRTRKICADPAGRAPYGTNRLLRICLMSVATVHVPVPPLFS